MKSIYDPIFKDFFDCKMNNIKWWHLNDKNNTRVMIGNLYVIFSCTIDLLNDFYIRCKIKTYKDRTTVGIPLCLM